MKIFGINVNLQINLYVEADILLYDISNMISSDIIISKKTFKPPTSQTHKIFQTKFDRHLRKSPDHITNSVLNLDGNIIMLCVY